MFSVFRRLEATGLFSWWSPPRRRQQVLTVSSGLLIGVALVADYAAGLGTLRAVLMTAAAAIAGGDIARRAVRHLGNRHVSIELLVTIAALGAILIGEYWEAAAVTFLFALGAYLEARTMRRTRQALGALIDRAPSTAIVVRDGEQREVPARDLASGPGQIPTSAFGTTQAAGIEMQKKRGETVAVLQDGLSGLSRVPPEPAGQPPDVEAWMEERLDRDAVQIYTGVEESMASSDVDTLVEAVGGEVARRHFDEIGGLALDHPQRFESAVRTRLVDLRSDSVGADR